jgi:hypothetical protein
MRISILKTAATNATRGGEDEEKEHHCSVIVQARDRLNCGDSNVE